MPNRVWVIALLCLALQGCGLLCSERDTADVVNADGSYRARAFIRGCGPKLPAPFVTIRGAGTAPSRSDDVLLAGRALGPIEVGWESGRVLRVVLTKVTLPESREAIREAKFKWRDVKVKYYHRAFDTAALTPLN